MAPLLAALAATVAASAASRSLSESDRITFYLCTLSVLAIVKVMRVLTSMLLFNNFDQLCIHHLMSL